MTITDIMIFYLMYNQNCNILIIYNRFNKCGYDCFRLKLIISIEFIQLITIVRSINGNKNRKKYFFFIPFFYIHTYIYYDFS